MQKRYFLVFAMCLFAIGLSAISQIDADFRLFSLEKVKEKQKTDPINKSKINYSKTNLQKSARKIINKKAVKLLAPTITATNTVTVQGGGNAAPGKQLNYSVLINNTGSDATGVSFTDILVSDLTLVAGSVKATPIALNDSYTSIGNVGITVPEASGVLTNDISPDGTALTAIAVTNAATTDGGKITITATGAIDYTPKTGTSATSDSYTYTLNAANGLATTATINITISNTIWFVNNTVGASGDGSLASPYKLWSDFGTNNTGATLKPQNNHTIFIYTGSGDYTGTVTLRAGQKVIGQGATASLVVAAGITLPSFSKTLPTTSGTSPNLTSSGTTITLGSGNTLGGFNMGNSTNYDIAGTSFGTLIVSEMTLNGTGGSLNLATGAVNATFNSITSNSAFKPITLSGVTGTLTCTGVSLSSPSNTGIEIAGSSTLTANFGNTSITSSIGTGLSITGGTGNTSIINFGDMDIACNSGVAAITTTHSGTLSSTSGTITTSNVRGIALNGGSSVLKETLNLVLDSYSASGATKGLEILNTLGSFTINGTGTTAGSGGTISNITNRGVDANTASNITLKNMNFVNANTAAAASSATDYSLANGAITLNNVSGVTFTKIAISGTTLERGITGKTISNFTLNGGSTITDCGDQVNEGCLYLQELTGTCNISGATLSKGSENLARVFNSSGALTLNIGTDATTTIFNDVQTQNANMTTPGALSALRSYCFIYTTAGSSTATATLNVRNTSFLKAGTHGFKVISDGSGTVNANIKSCTFNNDNATFAPNDQGGSIEMTSFNTANLNYNILNNSCRGKDISLINIVAQVNSNAQGRVNDNIITHSGTGSAGDGIRFSAEQSSDITTEVLRNTVSGMGTGVGISATAILGDGKINATITNNTVTITDPLASHNIAVVAGNTGTTFSNYTCANVANNTTTRPDLVNGFNFRVRAVTSGGTHKVYLQGTGATSAADVWANNGNTPTGAVVAQSGTFGTHIFSSTNGGALATCAVVSNPTYNSIATLPVAENIDIVAEETPLNDGIKTKETEEAAPQDTEVTTQETEVQISTESTNSTTKIAAPLSGETITVNGTGSGFSLPAGKSTTITFSATIANPTTVCDLTNFAIISGTNFPNLTSNTTHTAVTIDPIVSSTISKTSVCSGGTINLTATCPVGSTTNWYTENGGGAAVSTNNPAYSPSNITAPTSYYAACQLGACTSQRTLVGAVAINALPDATISAAATVCQGSPLTLNAPNIAGNTYDWAGNGVAATNTFINNAVPATYGSLIYTVTVTDAIGCKTVGNKTVNVNPKPVVTTTSAQTICVGSSAALIANCVMNVSAVLSPGANASTATGYAYGTYNTLTDALNLTIVFNGLTSNISNSHVHIGATGVNGGVIVPFGGWPTATSGSFTYAGSASVIGLATTNIPAFLAGNTYVNIHSINFPGGEIRGQLMPVCSANTYTWNPGALVGQTVNVSPLVDTPYTLVASNSVTGCTSTTVNTSVNVTPVTLPTGASTALTRTIIGNTLFKNNCEYLATVAPGGASPISGNVSVTEFVESTTFPYLKRHYEIMPATQGSGVVTLYYTQADFNAYNAIATNLLKFPTGSGDNGGIANIQIIKYSGVSSPNDGLPAHYPAQTPTIIASPLVNYNTNTSLWELTFDVGSFSGFFTTTASNPLPVKLISFSGKNTEKGNELTWKTSNEKNFSHFEIERSSPLTPGGGISNEKFEKIGEIKSNKSEIYEFLDISNQISQNSNLNYYRLKMIDLDGKFSFSKIISIENKIGKTNVGNFYPNPSASNSNIEINANESGNWNIITYDILGKKINSENRILQKGLNKISIEKLNKGVNFVRFDNGEISEIRKVINQ
jgi:trimeric autotransporter adhesin